MSTKSKKASLKSHLISMFSMVIVAAIALGGATYAWFTYVDNPEIRDIDLYVKAAPNILLSASTAKMYDEVDPTKINDDNFNNASLWHATLFQRNPDAVNQDGSLIDSYTGIDGTRYIEDSQKYAFAGRTLLTGMSDVSSVFADTGPNFYRRVNAEGGEDFEEYLLADGPTDVKSGHYTKFDLWIKSSNSGVIYLDGTVIDNIAQSFVKALAADQPKKSVDTTVRVGFYTAKDHDPDDAAARAVIWEPNSHDHIPANKGGFGTIGFKPTMAIAKPFDKVVDPTGTVGGTDDEVEEQICYDFANNVAPPADSKPSNVTSADTLLDPNVQIALFYLEKDKPLKFSVYIWVEGADVDTNNVVAETGFKTKLRFAQMPEFTSTGSPEKMNWAAVTS